MANYLRSINGSPYFYAYLNIPVDVRHAFDGKRNIKQTLKTTDKKLASELALPIVGQWKAKIRAARETNSTTTIDKLGQIQKLLADIRKDAGKATTQSEKDNLDRAATYYEDAVVDLMGISDTPTPKEIAKFKLATAQSTSFAGAFEEYLKEIPAIKAMTKSIKKSVIETFDAWTKNKPVEDLTRNDVLKYQQHLLDEGKKSSSIKITIAHLKTYYGTMWPDNKNIFQNVTGKLPKPNKFDARQAFTVPQIQQLDDIIKEQNDPLLLPIWQIAKYTGCRVGEVCNLKIDDIDLDAQNLTIRESKSYAGQRVIPIADSLLPTIKELIAKADSDFLIYIKSKNKDGRRSTIPQRRFHIIRDELQMGSKLVFHSLRKSFASVCQSKQIPEATVAAILGHANAGTSSLSYSLYSSGPDAKQMKEAVETVAAVLDDR